ncbi:MAG TPA: aldo/keto reductase [Promineifilum sp.]|nr:aldo/keto reductase [Promineifilum sp.]
MSRIEFNETGLLVTRMGLGLAALGRPGYINLGHAADLEREYDPASMESHAHRVLDAAWRLGIRYFDAARSYGRAEEFLSTWLKSRGIRPEEVTVGSKWGYIYTAGWQVQADKHEVKEHSLPVFQRQLSESRALLGPYLKLYQIHSATLDSGVLDNHAVLDGLAELRDEGIVVGLSLSGPRQSDTLRKALSIRIGGVPLFGSVQATWNLLAREATVTLREAHDLGVGVIIKEALANGRLTSRNDDPAFADKHHTLEQLAIEKGTTIDAIALAAVLAQPWVDIVLSGAAQVQHLESNIQALKAKWDDESDRRLAYLVEPAVEYWQARERLDWN